MQKSYLIDKDKELAEILLGKSPEIVSFSNKSISEKLEFIESVLRRLKPYLDEDRYACFDIIEKNSLVTLGSCWNSHVHAYHIYKNNEYTIQIGWQCKHGRVFEFYQNDGLGNISVSIYSEGHPEKEFTEKWEFFKHESKMHEFCIAFESSNTKITTIKEIVDEIKINPDELKFKP